MRFTQGSVKLFFKIQRYSEIKLDKIRKFHSTRCINSRTSKSSSYTKKNIDLDPKKRTK